MNEVIVVPLTDGTYEIRNENNDFIAGPEKDESDLEFSECAFVSCGLGMRCESCMKHLTRPFSTPSADYPVDREFLPQIEEYYRERYT